MKQKLKAALLVGAVLGLCVQTPALAVQAKKAEQTTSKKTIKKSPVAAKGSQPAAKSASKAAAKPVGKTAAARSGKVQASNAAPNSREQTVMGSVLDRGCGKPLPAMSCAADRHRSR